MLINNKKNRGFTLLEVLIAVLVLAIGLLGMSVLTLSSLSFTHGASLRGQAVVSAYDMIDRLRANRDNAESSDYDITVTADPPSASDAAASIAQYDLREWLNELSVRLPQGDGSIACVVDACTVAVQWDDQSAVRSPDETTQKMIQIEARL